MFLCSALLHMGELGIAVRLEYEPIGRNLDRVKMANYSPLLCFQSDRNHKEIPDWTNTLNQMVLTDMYRTFHSIVPEYIFTFLCDVMLGIKLSALPRWGQQSYYWTTFLALEHISFSSEHGAFFRIDHLLGHNTSCNIFKKTEIIYRIASYHNRKKSITGRILENSQISGN
jgi:hypothetical protein